MSETKIAERWGPSWFAPNRPWWMDAMFAHYHWYRRWCGGHWELAFNEITHSLMWERCSVCSKNGGIRPMFIRCTPLCEDYGQMKEQA